MKKDLIDILCCPTCKGELKLKVNKKENEEIITGSFTCEKCKCIYPIKDGIPDLNKRFYSFFIILIIKNKKIKKGKFLF